MEDMGPMSGAGVEAKMDAAVKRALRGELGAVGALIDAMPADHPRRRILLANYRQAVALLGDIPGILTR